jgi:prevent-host-death family protein
MKTMAASEFKARCLQVMEQVRSTRAPVVITKRGKPVAKLMPPDEAPARALGRLAGRIEILGDIVSPLVPLEDWESLK